MAANTAKCPYCGATILRDITGTEHVYTCTVRRRFRDLTA